MLIFLSIFAVAPITMFLSYHLWTSYEDSWLKTVLALLGFLLLVGSISSGVDTIQDPYEKARVLQIVLFVFVEVISWGVLLGAYFFSKRNAHDKIGVSQ